MQTRKIKRRYVASAWEDAEEEPTPKAHCKSTGLLDEKKCCDDDSSPTHSPEGEQQQLTKDMRTQWAQLHALEEFKHGNLVWAKTDRKNDPYWPAQVADTRSGCLPVSVRACCKPNSICVMFLGTSSKKHLASASRDFAWVKAGNVVPFRDYYDLLHKPKGLKDRAVWLSAVEEALMVEGGFGGEEEAANGYTTLGANQPVGYGSNGEPTEETAPGGPGRRMRKHKVQAAKYAECCSCDATVPIKQADLLEDGRWRCHPCVTLVAQGQSCPVCERTWLPSDDHVPMVQCDAQECRVWVHADCDGIHSVEEYETKKYFCPTCREAQRPAAATGAWDVVPQGQGGQPQAAEQAVSLGFRRSADDLPDRIRAYCNGVTGELLPKELSVVCLCASCGRKSTPWGLPAWERHVGSRAKKYKVSVKVEIDEQGRTMYLGRWMEQMLGDTAAEFLPTRAKGAPVTTSSQGLADPLVLRWPTEICAVCDDPTEVETNRLLTCDRCLISVHEECYVGQVDAATGTYLCTVCAMGLDVRSTDVQCCLCPVQGGALKPTDDGRWAHVMCAIWVPETEVSDLNTVGLVGDIRRHRWKLICEICHKRWGAPVQCRFRQCLRAYHPMCARIAGYCMKYKVMPNGAVEPQSFCFKHSRSRALLPTDDNWKEACQQLFPNLGVGGDVAAASTSAGTSSDSDDDGMDDGDGDDKVNGVPHHWERARGDSGAMPARAEANGHVVLFRDGGGRDSDSGDGGGDMAQRRRGLVGGQPGGAARDGNTRSFPLDPVKSPMAGTGRLSSSAHPAHGRPHGSACAENGHANGNGGSPSMYLRHQHVGKAGSPANGTPAHAMPASMSQALQALAHAAAVDDRQCATNASAERPEDVPGPGQRGRGRQRAVSTLERERPFGDLAADDATPDDAPRLPRGTAISHPVPSLRAAGAARCEPYRPQSTLQGAASGEPADGMRGGDPSKPPLPLPPASAAAVGRERSDGAHSQVRPTTVAFYDVGGFCWHPEVAQEFRHHKVQHALSKERTLSIADRIQAVKERARDRLCFGKSAIHGWGLHTRHAFQQGEMVIEYIGELVRGPISELRAQKYLKEGQGCYLFKIDNNLIIDATTHGNIARLVNHSCQPSCYAKIIDGRDKQRHVMFFARRDIKAGEEITYDYKFEVDENDKVGCHCGAEGCRGYM